MNKPSELRVEIPEDVQIEISGKKLTVSFQGKQLSREFKSNVIDFANEGNVLVLKSKNSRRKTSATMNSMASHVRNMVRGIKHGFQYTLEAVYSHFPMNLTVKNGFVEINNLAGAKAPRRSNIVGNTSVEIKGNSIVVKGIGKEDTGQTAANLETATKIRGKDSRIFQDGIYIVTKPTKGPGEE
ncbi:MAG: 50S ribosomal protein L6 [Candidatus Diapherotrites archaeon]